MKISAEVYHFPRQMPQDKLNAGNAAASLLVNNVQALPFIQNTRLGPIS